MSQVVPLAFLSSLRMAGHSQHTPSKWFLGAAIGCFETSGSRRKTRMWAEPQAAASAQFSAALWGSPSVAPVSLPGRLATVGGINNKGFLRARLDSISELLQSSGEKSFFLPADALEPKVGPIAHRQVLASAVFSCFCGLSEPCLFSRSELRAHRDSAVLSQSSFSSSGARGVGSQAFLAL